jgi:hypothetical protein
MREITEKTLHLLVPNVFITRFTTNYGSKGGRDLPSRVPVRTVRVVSTGRTALKTAPSLDSLPTRALSGSLLMSNSTNVRTAKADFRAMSRNSSTRIATTPSPSLTSVCFMPRRIRSTSVNGFSRISTVAKLIETRSSATPSGSATRDPRPCPHCGETTVWKNGYRTNRLLAVLIASPARVSVAVPPLPRSLGRTGELLGDLSVVVAARANRTIWARNASR